MKSQTQAAKISFLRKVTGLSLRDKLRSLDIRDEFVELVLLSVQSSQMMWFGHLVKISGMPIQGGHPGQTKDTLKRLYLLASFMSWCPPRRVDGSGRGGKVWISLHKLLPLRPSS